MPEMTVSGGLDGRLRLRLRLSFEVPAGSALFEEATSFVFKIGALQAQA
jgi:hypothetical protein